MFDTARIALFAATALSTAAFAASAGACGATGSRPGTPNEESSALTSQNTIVVSWTNRAKIGAYGGAIYIDISVRRKDLPKDKSLDKHNLRYTADYGSRSSFTFPNLGSNVEYCFQIWTRKEPNGCRSEKPTNPTCKTTPGLSGPVTPPPKEPRKVPEITAYWLEGNVFRVEGKYFRPNASVTLKVSGSAAAKSSVTAKADAQGRIDVKYSDLCARSGPLGFRTTPGLKRDTRMASAKCQLPGYTPNRKLPL